MWLGAAAAIVAAALVGIAKIVTGDAFDEPNWQVLATALAGALCGGAALAGVGTIENDPRHPLGWAILGLAVAAFAVLALGIWWDEGWNRHGERLGRVVLTAVAALFAALVVGVARRSLRLRLPQMRVLYWAFVSVVAATTLFVVAAIWIPELEDVARQTKGVDRVERALAALYVAIVALFLVFPLVERALTELAERRQRVDRSAA